jgi:sigma-B regulation protein RsbU (phosphoserine phosphatase)
MATLMSLDELRAEVHRLNRRLHAVHEQLDESLALTRRIQQAALPRSLPQVAGLDFAVYQRSNLGVGGACHDVFELDDAHIAFYVADVMGRGLPAGLLTLFVKQHLSVHKDCFDPPGEVLERLNRELIAQQLSDTPFIAMLYGVVNHRDRLLTFARAGGPCPLVLPRDSAAARWQLEGTLLGVLDGRYPERAQELRPGDKVLFPTTEAEDAVSGLASRAETLCSTPIQKLIGSLAGEILQKAPRTDHFVLLGLEVA